MDEARCRCLAAFGAAALTVALILVPGRAAAQDSGASAARPMKATPMAPPVTESVDTIMQREAFEPPPMLVPPPEEAENELTRGRPHAPRVNPLSPAVSQWPMRDFSLMTPQEILSPQTVGTSFTAVITPNETAFFPPDSMGDIGPSQILVHVNGRIKVFSRSGVLGSLNATANNFWTSTRNGQGVTDPEIRYDRLSNRWFLIASNTPATNNRIMVAYQTTPGGTITASSSFTFTFFVSTGQGDAGCFADFPSLGVDANALYIGTNMFCPTSYVHSNVYVMPKSNLLGGSPIAYSGINMMTGAACSWDTTGTYFAGPYSPQGVDSDDPQGTEGYFVGVDLCDTGTLQFRRIGTPGGIPSVTPNITLLVPATAGSIPQPASGSATALDTGDDRLIKAAIHKNKITGVSTLWTAQNIEVDASCTGVEGGGRNGARWYELASLTTTPTLVQSGTLCDPAASNPRGYIYPSVVGTGQGHMALGATFASPVAFAGVATAGRLRSDTLGVTQAATVAQAGLGSYNVLATDGRNRWGDFSFTDVDPNDDMTVWTFQEYTPSTDNWAVRAIQLKAPPPATPFSASPATICQGQNPVSVTITGTSASGSEFFDPGPDTGGPGYLNHLAASLAGGTAPSVSGITFTDPIHVTLSLNASSATTGAKNVTITNPDGQIATGNGILTVSAVPATPAASSNGPICAGNTLQLFASTVAGATYAWTGPNSFTASVQNPMIPQATPAASGIYSVTVTVNGCTSAAGNASAIVNATPAAPTAGNNGPICAGATLQLSASLVSGGSYLWTGPNGFVSNQQNPSISPATAAASGVYSVTVTLSGCTSQAGTTTATVTGTGQACSDGSLCTTGDVCQAGGACSGTPVVCTALDQCHVAGICDPGTGVCSNPNAANGTACSDGDACTTGDACSGGICQPGAGTPNCDDGNPCTNDSCSQATGCVHANNANPCSDGSACTIGDTCGNGACIPGTPVVCNDNNVCTTDTCNQASGCLFTNNANPCDDGNACTVGDTCGGGVCGGGSPGPVEVIQNGGFQSGTGATGCGANAFQRTFWTGTGSAIQHSGCGWTGPDISVSLGSPDGMTAGTISQSFAATTGPGTLTYKHGSHGSGSCSYTVTFGPSNTVVPVTNAALVAGLANAGSMPVPTGTTSVTFANPDCSAGGLALVQFDNVSLTAGGNVRDCNDNNPCTTDSCNPASGCVYTNNTNACNDGSACTSGDTCSGGACVGTPVVCNDNNVCTDDTCNTATGCVYTNNTNACDDGNGCTQFDTCGGGTCNPGPLANCNDNNPCTTEHCDPVTGCVFDNNTIPCNDGNACTAGDTCGGGTCQPGAPVVCNDNNVCTNDSCNPASGCVFSNNVNACDDGNACTAGDSCGGGTCQPGAPVVCNDNNVCTNDSCNPASGCVYTNNTNPCDDGNACTAGDTCGGGTCHSGTPVLCNDNNVCTNDSCNPATGCVYVNNTNACDDGNPCTVGDVCGNGVCNGGTTITAPPETQGMQAGADKSTYSWSAAPLATQYDVVRGSVRAFPVGPGGGDETCFDNLPGTSLSDPTVPAPSDGFWYLSRGENACGIGTFGTQSNGSPRTTTTCP